MLHAKTVLDIGIVPVEGEPGRRMGLPVKSVGTCRTKDAARQGRRTWARGREDIRRKKTAKASGTEQTSALSEGYRAVFDLTR